MNDQKASEVKTPEPTAFEMAWEALVEPIDDWLRSTELAARTAKENSEEWEIRQEEREIFRKRLSVMRTCVQGGFAKAVSVLENEGFENAIWLDKSWSIEQLREALAKNWPALVLIVNPETAKGGGGVWLDKSWDPQHIADQIRTVWPGLTVVAVQSGTGRDSAQMDWQSFVLFDRRWDKGKVISAINKFFKATHGVSGHDETLNVFEVVHRMLLNDFRGMCPTTAVQCARLFMRKARVQYLDDVSDRETDTFAKRLQHMLADYARQNKPVPEAEIEAAGRMLMGRAPRSYYVCDNCWRLFTYSEMHDMGNNTCVNCEVSTCKEVVWHHGAAPFRVNDRTRGSFQEAVAELLNEYINRCATPDRATIEQAITCLMKHAGLQVMAHPQRNFHVIDGNLPAYVVLSSLLKGDWKVIDGRERREMIRMLAEIDPPIKPVDAAGAIQPGQQCWRMIELGEVLCEGDQRFMPGDVWLPIPERHWGKILTDKVIVYRRPAIIAGVARHGTCVISPEVVNKSKPTYDPNHGTVCAPDAPINALRRVVYMLWDLQSGLLEVPTGMEGGFAPFLLKIDLLLERLDSLFPQKMQLLCKELAGERGESTPPNCPAEILDELSDQMLGRLAFDSIEVINLCAWAFGRGRLGAAAEVAKINEGLDNVLKAASEKLAEKVTLLEKRLANWDLRARQACNGAKFDEPWTQPSAPDRDWLDELIDLIEMARSQRASAFRRAREACGGSEPSGTGRDWVDELAGLLRVTRGQRDAAEHEVQLLREQFEFATQTADPGLPPMPGGKAKWTKLDLQCYRCRKDFVAYDVELEGKRWNVGYRSLGGSCQVVCDKCDSSTPTAAQISPAKYAYTIDGVRHETNIKATTVANLKERHDIADGVPFYRMLNDGTRIGLPSRSVVEFSVLGDIPNYSTKPPEDVV